MKSERVEKLAELIVNYCMDIKKDENVLIQSTTIAVPLIKEIYKKCLERGAYPDTKIILDGFGDFDLKYGSDDFLQNISPYTKAEAKYNNKFISIGAPYITSSDTSVNQNRAAIRQKSFGNIRDIKNKRQIENEYMWLVTAYPCFASAQDAKMSLEQYEDYIAGAMKLDEQNPIEAWLKVRAYQQKIVEYLTDKSQIKIKSTNAELNFITKGRTWINGCGEGNFPDGEVYTAPLENSMNGWIVYNYPCKLYGEDVINIRFEYKDGKVVKASSDKGQDAVLRMLNLDDGMKYIGEFAFGTNYGITRFISNGLFDEKRGGTMHIANGATLPETGGKNQASVHWDNITEMLESEVYADGELFYKDGKFLI